MTTEVDQLTAQWQELLHAAEFAAKCFEHWQQKGTVGAEQSQAIARYYEELRESWSRAAQAHEALPAEVDFPPGEPVGAGPIRAIRVWKFVANQVHRLHAAGRLTFAQKHACLMEVNERLAALRRRVQEESPGAVMAQTLDRTVEAPGSAARTSGAGPSASPQLAEAASAARTRKPIAEILLDPRGIQGLLALGGALMVVGLVILLWVNEFFTPPIVAVTLGLANVALLAAGWFVLRQTRFRMAGNAITLLACFVMPLNLWYYHANDLITIDGHLWVAAVVISALYAASAWVLKDELFVYVFVAGVTLMGLLILADLPPSPDRFWEIALPSTLLVALGLVSIHTERAFAEAEGPFGRKRFGLAFFWSGHALLAAGLLLVLGAQAAGWWLYEPLFKPLYESLQAQPSPIVSERELRLLALGLVLAGTYAYIYSDIVVRRIGAYVHVAAFTLLWAVVLLVDLLGLELGIDALIAVFAAISLVVNGIGYPAARGSQMTRAFPVLGFLFAWLPVLLGLWVYLRALGLDLQGVWQDEPPSWSYVGAMLLTAAACRMGAFSYRHNMPRLSAGYFFGTAAALLVACVAFLASQGLTKWHQHAPWMMLVPIAYVGAARMYRGGTSERPLVWVSHAAAIVMLLSSLGSALRGFTTVVQGEQLNLALALFFAEAAAFYLLVVLWHRHPLAVHMATLMASGSLWQLMTFGGFSSEFYTLIFALLGLALLVGYRFALVKPLATGGLAEAAFQSANTVLSLALVAAVLMGLSRFAEGHIEWPFIGLCSLLTVLSLAAAGLVRQAGWRRWYVVTSIAQALLVFLGIQVLSVLSTWQKMEIFSVVVGVLLLVVGHIGWYREEERESDLVSTSLFLGSLLAGFPLAIATLVDRYRVEFGGFELFNELGFLAVSIALLATGFVFQLKSTTICGAGLTLLYFLTLLIYVPWSRLNTVAIAIIVGGGILFGTGVLLSLYRDRLLTLPDRIKRREGIFRVLNWR